MSILICLEQNNLGLSCAKLRPNKKIAKRTMGEWFLFITTYCEVAVGSPAETHLQHFALKLASYLPSVISDK